MENDFVTVPMLAIHPNRINLYSEVHWNNPHGRKNPAHTLKGVSKDHQGKVSKVARRKINKAIDYLLFVAANKTLPDTPHGQNYKFKLSFVTLTLPSTQQHSDQEIKDSLLNQFLVEARKRWNVRNYLWRAEKQKNGNIHFHILTDKFIPWSELRDTWNRICNKLDYVNNYRDQMRRYHSGGLKIRKNLLQKWSYKAQVKAYKTGAANDWASPNSTDIHAVHKIKDITAYISKYCTKEEQNGVLNGRLWGCNKSLSSIPGGKIVRDNEVSQALASLFDKYSPRVYEGDYFSCLYINFNMLQDSDSTVLFEALSTFMIDHFDFHIQKSIQ